MKKTLNKNECKEVFRPFAEKDFISWKPWPRSFIDSCFDSMFIKQSDVVKGSAGSDFLPAYFAYFKTENYSNNIRIWTRNDKFLKLDTEFPDINIQLNETVKLPDEGVYKLDYSFGGFVIKEGEWVFPEKGIAYFLNGDYNRIIKISIFSSASIQFYKMNLHPAGTIREFN